MTACDKGLGPFKGMTPADIPPPMHTAARTADLASPFFGRQSGRSKNLSLPGHPHCRKTRAPAGRVHKSSPRGVRQVQIPDQNHRTHRIPPPVQIGCAHRLPHEPLVSTARVAVAATRVCRNTRVAGKPAQLPGAPPHFSTSIESVMAAWTSCDALSGASLVVASPAHRLRRAAENLLVVSRGRPVARENVVKDRRVPYTRHWSHVRMQGPTPSKRCPTKLRVVSLEDTAGAREGETGRSWAADAIRLCRDPRVLV
ncbi:hypothetical protein LXA43DRAFT_1035983 [Ganoderma leucocontextum]|nr:hypothetical protein LXA43DRAFT_1035930 [Ganoderma leucocontextum]KAI1785880.1 hypothetical protein LXA43DRAFT_1035955 [Ganoderma leucocontextum]KAI1785883.1 hypothetical protein LXA43DRAFT_1035983 [Ganoderma leucocontextum]